MTNVSIIIPTFNRARFLGEAIESALAQGSDVDVIVVDDGSTDGTEALLFGYHGRINVLRQRNQGPSAARNFGAELARGDYLFFLDSDDTLVPGAIGALLAEARRLGDGAVPFGRASTVDAAGAAMAGPSYGYPWVLPGQSLSLGDLLSGIMPLWLLLLNRRVFLGLGGLDQGLRLGEDHEFAVRLHRSGVRFVATDLAMIRIRVHDAPRLSCSANPRHGGRLLTIWQRIVDLAAQDTAFDKQARAGLASRIWLAGRDAARSGERQAADQLFELARRTDATAGADDPLVLRLAQRLASPYCAERWMQRIKAAIRR